MRNYVIVSVVSALATAALLEVWRSAGQPHALVAQEPRLESPPTGTAESSRRGLISRLPPPPSPLADDLTLTAEESVNVNVYENVNRSVVNIITKTVRNDAFFFLDVEVPAEGAGSGCVLDRLGHILTNYHVVDGAAKSRSRCSTARATTDDWSARTSRTTSRCSRSKRPPNRCCR